MYTTIWYEKINMEKWAVNIAYSQGYIMVVNQWQFMLIPDGSLINNLCAGDLQRSMCDMYSGGFRGVSEVSTEPPFRLHLA